MLRFLQHVVLILLCLASTGRPDIDSDRAECTDQLVGLSTCLAYVGGDAKSPTPDCCSGFKEVTSKSIKCVCVLVKDRNDPSLGLKIDVNRALSLPSKCNSPPVNASTCPKLLNLPPNSPEAKEFYGFEDVLEGKGKSANGSATTTPTTTPAASVNGKQSTSSGRRQQPLRLEMGGVRIWSVLLLLLLPFLALVG